MSRAGGRGPPPVLEFKDTFLKNPGAELCASSSLELFFYGSSCSQQESFSLKEVSLSFSFLDYLFRLSMRLGLLKPASAVPLRFFDDSLSCP
jgi:hypothetical protein